MHASDDVPVAVGASNLQADRISRSGEPSLSPADASSFPQQSRATRSATTASNKIASENEVVRQIYKQITPTLNPGDNGIWSEIDLLEGDPMHRGVAMRNPRHKPFVLRAEGDQWQGL